MTGIEGQRHEADVIMVNRDDRNEMTTIAERVVSTFVVMGRHTKNLPADVKAAWLVLLPRLMVDAYHLQQYCTIIRTERQKQSVHELLLMLPGEEIPIEAIAKDGFHLINDAVLADLALCPEALTTLRNELFDNPDLDSIKGNWFHAAEQEAYQSRKQPPAVLVTTQAMVPTTQPRVALWKITLLTLFTGLLATSATWLIVSGAFSTSTHTEGSQSTQNSRDSIISQTVGTLSVQIDEFRMMSSSHPETPYKLKITTTKPVYLMHLFTWTSDSVPVVFAWHGENYSQQIPTGTTDVIYPNDAEKRKFQGFSGLILVFTSQKVPLDFWKRLESLPNGARSSAYIDRTRDFVLAELGKIGIPPANVFIFAALETTIQKE